MSPKPGSFSRRSDRGPIPWIISICCEEVLEGELPLEHPLGVFLGLLLVDDALEVLHQADDVAHAEDAARHALGAELLEGVHALAHAGELDRRAGDLLDRERSAAAGVAVELGQDHARQVEPVVEGLGGLDRVLTDHGVDDEEDVVRLGLALDRRQLLHEGLVDGEATGGVVDDGVALELARVGNGAVADVDGATARDREDRDVDLLAEDLELLDGAGALHVGGDEQALPVLLGLEVARELGGGGRLPGALQADHHDAGGLRALGEAHAGFAFGDAIMATSSSWQILTKCSGA